MDCTTWSYDPATGLLTNKLDAAGFGPVYSYTAAGQLASRTWARGITTTYAYDPIGQLTNISYSDATPPVAFAYDRLGRQVVIYDILGARTNAYDNATLQLVGE